MRKSLYTDDDTNELREGFKLFADSNGKVKPHDLLSAVDLIGFKSKSPALYRIIQELDTEENAQGITFEQFLKHVNIELGDANSEEGARKLYLQFLEDPRDKKISFNTMKRLAKEFGENVDQDQLRTMLDKVSSNGNDINFEEFYQIIGRKV